VSTRQVVERVAEIVLAAKPRDRPLVVGVTGMDTSGKTVFAGRLAEVLYDRGMPFELVHVDDFHNPMAVRYAAAVPEPRQYYEFGFDFPRLVEQVLRPVREAGRLDVTLRLLDPATDSWTLDRRYSVTPESVLLVEGVFLLRPETRPWLDLTVYLDVTEAEVIKRARVRDVPTQGDEILDRYRTKYLAAQRAYLAEHPPEAFADVIVDNTDWSAPVLRRLPSGW
jgi:uridine kinase